MLWLTCILSFSASFSTLSVLASPMYRSQLSDNVEFIAFNTSMASLSSELVALWSYGCKYMKIICSHTHIQIDRDDTDRHKNLHLSRNKIEFKGGG